ncbi:TlpA disulfide reductase family protein [Yeosuana sp. AK3]
MKYVWFVILVGFLAACRQQKSNVDVAINLEETVESVKSNTDSIQLEVYDFSGFKKYLNRKDNAIYVINFWATWCAPCVKEIPFFEKLHSEYADKNVKVLLVSLDFPHLYDSKLKPFIIKKNIKSKVVALDDVDMNAWIPQISKDWSGSIPATLIYKNDDSNFFEQSFTYKTLEHEIIKFLN